MNDIGGLILYLALSFLAALFIYFGGVKRYSKGVSTTFILIGILIPTILCGLRYEVGSDFSDYQVMYDRAVSNSFSDFNDIYQDRSIEPSFYMLSQVSDFFVGNSSLVFALYGLITVTFFYLSAKYFSKEWAWLSVLVFLLIYFPIGLSGMRQFAAMSIFLFSLRYILDKKVVKYIVCIILASLFHQASIILLPVYALGRYFLNNRAGWFRLIPVILLGILLIITPVINIVLSLPLFARYEYMSELERSSTYVGGTYFIQLLLALVFALFFRSLSVKDERYRFLFPMFMVSILLYSIGFRFSSGWRLSLYMLPIAALLMPSIMESTDGRIKKYIPLMVIAFAVVYFVVVYYMVGNFDIFPLKFIGGADA